MRRSRPLALAVVLALVGCGRGCGNTSTPFDKTAGYEPLEPCTAAFPAPSGGDPHPETLVTTQGSATAWHWSHGAAYLHAPLTAVWAALQDPAVSRIHGPDWSVTGAVEPRVPAQLHHPL